MDELGYTTYKHKTVIRAAQKMTHKQFPALNSLWQCEIALSPVDEKVGELWGKGFMEKMSFEPGVEE